MTMVSIVSEGVAWKNPYPSSQARSALRGYSVVAPGGRIVHAMQIAQVRTSPDARAHVTATDDCGQTWSPIEPLTIGGDEDFNPTSLLPTRHDDALLACANHNITYGPDDPRWQKENGGWVGHRSLLCRSDDAGRTWRKLHPITPPPVRGGFFVISTPPLRTADERLMVIIEPMHSGATDEWDHEAAAMFSRDGGASWGDKVVVAKDPPGRFRYFDPRPARLASGRWVCMLWTHDTTTDQSCQTTLTRSDGDGRRWSPPQECPFSGFLTVPLVLPDGRLLAVFNHRRRPQGVRCIVSDDEGQTWDTASETTLWDQAARRVTGEPATQSERREWEGNVLAEMFTSFDFGIPSAVVLPDGTVFVTFYATQLDHVMHQRYVRLKMD